MVEVANNRTLIFRVWLYRTVLTYNVQFYHTVSYGRYGMAYVAVQYGRMVRPNFYIFLETQKSSKCNNLARKVEKKYRQNFAPCPAPSRTLAAVPYGRTVRPYGTVRYGRNLSERVRYGRTPYRYGVRPYRYGVRSFAMATPLVCLAVAS